MNTHPSDFTPLGAEQIFEAVERHSGVFLDGTLTHYNSYVNRVYGVRDDDENDWIVNSYRPGRWTNEAIQDEHIFLADCIQNELPVVAPLTGKNGSTLGIYQNFSFAVFPRLRARTFDIYTDEDWIRTGAIIGRLHSTGRRTDAPHRARCTPGTLTAKTIDQLRVENLVHPEFADDFFRISAQAIKIIEPLFSGVPLHRIHGDCHRGNMLETGKGELTLIDFDDMMTGPAIQDLWLLLPGYIEDSRAEMNLIIEGYEQFSHFDQRWLDLVEPLRFMRHLYFLGWQASQRNDEGFTERNPDWGGRAFWLTETEDLSFQLQRIAREKDSL